MNFLRALNFLPFVAPSPATTTPKTDVGRVLERAADLIETHGWVQGCYTDLDGRMCASQAISIAAEQVRNLDEYDNIRLGSEARAELMSRISREYKHVPAWNDKYYRTKGGVLRTLRKAAAEN